MAAEFITIKEYCVYHHTDESFIAALQQSGLIEVQQAEPEPLIPFGQLAQLERFTRWYQELDLNIEGIEVVGNLLQKIADMQEHVQQLEARLRAYEG